MARLFIIGNGYDISRRGDTKYLNFKKWVEKNYIKRYDLSKNIYKKNQINFLKCNNISTNSMDLIVSNLVECDNLNKLINIERKCLAAIILFKSMSILNDYDWNHFEENLSKLPLNNLINQYKEVNRKNNVVLKQSIVSPIDRETELLTSLSGEYCSLFCEWIKDLPCKKIKARGFENEIVKEIETEDVFIVFNYTKTIENMFKNNNLNCFYHLHGIYDDKDSIVIGHNCKEKSSPTAIDNLDDYINECYACLYKNPELTIRKNENLWNKLEQHNEWQIYEYGWSCSDVDKDYIIKLVEILKDKKVHLYLNNYNGNGIIKREQWIKYGFPADLISFYTENGNDIIFE